MKSKKSLLFVICTVVVFLLIGGCGETEDNPKLKKDAEELTNADSRSKEMNSTQKTNKQEVAAKISNGQKVIVDQFKFTVPKDWKGDTDTQVWFPATEDADVPLPSHCLYYGARPLMGISSLEAGIKKHLDLEPKDKKPITIGGLKGTICQWQRGSYKNIGLFLLEKDFGMDMMYFFICQAPERSFEQHVEIYQNILDSVSLK